jgi:hypothetical protein
MTFDFWGMPPSLLVASLLPASRRVELRLRVPTDREQAITYPGMDITLIQKEEELPQTGFVVNVEMQRHDAYENDGKFEPEEFDIMRGYFEQYQAASNAALLYLDLCAGGARGDTQSQ